MEKKICLFSISDKFIFLVKLSGFGVLISFITSFLFFRTFASDRYLTQESRTAEYNLSQISPSINPTKKEMQPKESVTEKRNRNILAYYKVLRQRLETASGRLKGLNSRIALRLTKMQDQGYDVSDLTAQLSQNQQKLTLIDQDILKLEASVSAMIQSNDPKTSFEEVRGAIKAVKENLINYHLELVSIINQIKAILPKITGGLSVSPSTITVSPTVKGP